MMRIVRSVVPVMLACFLAGLTIPTPAASVLRQDRAWKVYLNRELGYCVSYPSRWFKTLTYEGTGLAVTTGLKRHSPIPTGAIDVSALAAPDTHPASGSGDLDSDFDLQLAGLRKFVRAEQVEVLEKRAFVLGANPSLFVKIRYLDPRDRRVWVDEVIFANGQHLNYRLELEARADQLERFESIFTQFVNSFQMNCGSNLPAVTASNVAAFRLTQ